MTENIEELKEIAQYVSEQRLETDLGNVQGYGIDGLSRSVRFSLKPIADIKGRVDTLTSKVDGNTRNIAVNTQEIRDLKVKVEDIADNELPKRNRADIDRMLTDIEAQNTRIERDERLIKDNSDAITATRTQVSGFGTRIKTLEDATERQQEDIDGLQEKVALCSKVVYDLDGYTAIPGEVVQYGGDSGKYDHGGFYEWSGSAWVRLSVDDHSALEQKIKANTDAIATLNGGEQTSGSVKNTVLDYIGKAQHARFKVVQTLPPVSEAESNVMYLVPFAGKEGVYKQYVLSDGRFIELDNTEVDLSDYYNKHETDTAISDVADALTAKDTEQDAEIAKKANKSELAKVATSGSYSDLTNKPAIPSAQVNSDWNATTGVAQILNKPNLAKVATSGSYNDLTDKPTPPSPTSECVPYSDNLDGITDDKGVAWMNVGEGREFGHLYRKEQGGESIVIPARTYYITLPEGNATGLPAGKYYKTEEWFNGDLWVTNQSPYYYGNNNEKVGDKVWDGYGNYYAVTSVNYPFLTLDNGSEIWLQHGASEGGAYRYIHESGKYDLWYIGDQTLPEDWISSKDMRGFGQKRTTASGTEYVEWLGPVCTPYSDPSDMQRTTAEVIIGGSTWKDVYDTSAITADISAEVTRATTAESALSERINGKADASKWTEILYSQIDADHTTLGNLNTYLSTAKRGSIDDAIAKAHTQNTDTALAVDRVKWNGATNHLEITGGVYALNEVRSNNGAHTLSQKLNANMLRPYATTEDMLADMKNIPEGAWCAIINTHSGGVSAQSDDDYLL